MTNEERDEAVRQQLPPAMRRGLEWREKRWWEASALYRFHEGRHTQARYDLQNAETAEREWRRGRHETEVIPPMCGQRIAACRDALAIEERVSAEARAYWEGLGHVVSACQQSLKVQRRPDFGAQRLVFPTGRDDEQAALVATVDRIRQEIAHVQAAIPLVELAPVPLEEELAELDAYVARVGQRFAWSKADAVASHANTGEIWNGLLLRFLCSAYPDEVRARLGASVTQRHTPEVTEASIPRHERPARVAALRADLRRLEVEEESAILTAELSGLLGVPRRPDADPAAVLAVPVPLPPSTEEEDTAASAEPPSPPAGEQRRSNAAWL